MKRRVYLIERLWVDPMENRNAFGYKPIGVVESKREADRIIELEHVSKKDHPWPLNYSNTSGDTVPRFRAEEIPDLKGMSLEHLKIIGRLYAPLP